MGFGSSTPPPDPELEKLKAEEKARLEKERAEEKARKEERDRVRRGNLAGQRSLQKEDVKGFLGYRRMGKPSGSIRM
jgi:membrane protein involved in colicin uptake